MTDRVDYDICPRDYGQWELQPQEGGTLQIIRQKCRTCSMRYLGTQNGSVLLSFHFDDALLQWLPVSHRCHFYYHRDSQKSGMLWQKHQVLPWLPYDVQESRVRNLLILT